MAINGDQVFKQTRGGAFLSSHAAATTGAVCALTGAGRLCKVSILTVGSAATLIYDGTDNTGTVMAALPTNPTVGQIFEFEMPCQTGIFVGGAANTHGLSLSYNKSGANGQA